MWCLKKQTPAQHSGGQNPLLLYKPAEKSLNIALSIFLGLSSIPFY
jgi:hypothetical protein